jgi:uncharacterized RDD family membrane protein YckC
MSEPAIDLSQAASPGLLRRLAAICYDLLLLAGVLVLAAALATGVSGGQPITGLARLLFQLYLLLVCYLYFAWQWTKGGQTLGMRAWRLQLLRDDGRPLGWGDALKRLLLAGLALLPLGLGLLWSLFDPDRLAWHDRLSKTRLVLVRK